MGTTNKIIIIAPVFSVLLRHVEQKLLELLKKEEKQVVNKVLSDWATSSMKYGLNDPHKDYPYSIPALLKRFLKTMPDKYGLGIPSVHARPLHDCEGALLGFKPTDTTVKELEIHAVNLDAYLRILGFLNFVDFVQDERFVLDHLQEYQLLKLNVDPPVYAFIFTSLFRDPPTHRGGVIRFIGTESVLQYTIEGELHTGEFDANNSKDLVVFQGVAHLMSDGGLYINIVIEHSKDNLHRVFQLYNIQDPEDPKTLNHRYAYSGKYLTKSRKAKMVNDLTVLLRLPNKFQNWYDPFFNSKSKTMLGKQYTSLVKEFLDAKHTEEKLSDQISLIHSQLSEE